MKYEREMNKNPVPKSIELLCSESLYILKEYQATKAAVKAKINSKKTSKPKNHCGTKYIWDIKN